MIQYKKTKAGKWYFTITGPNGKQLVSSQKTYNRKANAQIGVNSLLHVLTTLFETEPKTELNIDLGDQKFKNHKRLA
jgi:uncharacterized protein YegP (UPF0339 family)